MPLAELVKAVGPVEVHLAEIVTNPHEDTADKFESCAGLAGDGFVSKCAQVEVHDGDDSRYIFAEYGQTTTPPAQPFLTGGWVHAHYGLCKLYAPDERDKERGFALNDLHACAVRLMFHRFEQGVPAGETTDNYTAILDALVASLGAPPGYWALHGPQAAAVQLPILEFYRWCGSERGHEWTTVCPAAVVFVFDQHSQTGMVLMVTPAVYTFLYAHAHFPYPPLHPFGSAYRYFAFLFTDPLYLLGSKVAQGPVLCDTCGPETFKLSHSLRKQFTPELTVDQPANGGAP